MTGELPASCKDQLQAPLGHLLPRWLAHPNWAWARQPQSTWWTYWVTVITKLLYSLLFGLELSDELFLGLCWPAEVFSWWWSRNMKENCAASQRDVCAESHLGFGSQPKITFQRAYVTLPKSSWWIAVSLNLNAEWGSSSKQSSRGLFTNQSRMGPGHFVINSLKRTYLAWFRLKCSGGARVQRGIKSGR